MLPKVSTELIERQARELQRLRHAEGRSTELAEEVDTINREVFRIGETMDLNEEPGGFFRVLHAGRESGGARR